MIGLICKVIYQNGGTGSSDLQARGGTYVGRTSFQLPPLGSPMASDSDSPKAAGRTEYSLLCSLCCRLATF